MFFKSKKLISQTRYIIIASSLLFLLFSFFFSSILYAADEANQLMLPNEIVQNNAGEDSYLKKGCKVVYRFVSEHEHLLVPLSGAMAGEVRCGVWCAAVGWVLGVLDEVAIYSRLVDRHYLTWGIFGITTGHILNPSVVSDLAGVAVGVLLPTGILNEHEELIVPLVSTIAGDPMLTLSSIVDELAINSGITDKHYMTFLSVGGKVTNKLLGHFNLLVSDFIGVILGSLAANYEEEITSTVLSSAIAPIKTSKNLYKTYSKFIPKDQLDSNLEKQALVLIGGQFLVRFLDLKIIGYRQNVEYNFQRLNTHNSLARKGFTSELTNFAIFLFPYLIGQTVSDQANNYFNKKNQYFLEDKIRSEFFSEEIIGHLSNDTSFKVLTDNLKGDISTITKSGSNLIAGAVASSMQGIYGIGIIIVTSPNALAYSFLYSQVQSFILEHLAEQQRFYEEKNIVLASEIKYVMQHDTANIRTIAERDGMVATRTRLQQLYTTSRECETSQEIWDSASRLWRRVSEAANYIVNYYLVGNEINQGRLSFDDRGKAHIAGWQVSNWLSWSGRNAQDISKIEQSLNRILVLEGKIHARPSYLDQINRVAQEGNQLMLQNLEIGVDNRVLVLVEDLKLEMGKVYAITGQPGCGKSLLLSKIKGITTNGISGKGGIYYPLVNGKTPKIIMVSQQDYFPVGSSLQEVILWPDIISNDPVISNKQKEEIQLLLKEIRLLNLDVPSDQALNLYSVRDWPNILSGGEKKKAMMVSAIIKKPDILILDETFHGLDVEARIVAQRMLKKYLPHALILVVDHDAQANNYNHFYEKELHFAGKRILLREI